MSISVFEHPFLSGLFGDDREVADIFSADADSAAMLKFEAALAGAQGDLGIIPGQAGERIAAAARTLKPDMMRLKHGAAHDGVVVVALVDALRQAVGEDFAAHVHFGATSQDVIDTSLMLRLTTARDILLCRVQHLSDRFDRLEKAFGHNELTGWTRMQPAIPITVADRIESWRAPFALYRRRLVALQFPLQFGGAAGTLEKFGAQGVRLRSHLARRLGLQDRPQWHNQRAFIADFGHLLALVSGSLGKFGHDIALMAELGQELCLSGGGGSSTMPHKRNPIAAELLVSLARFNAGQASALHQAMVHEQERSGAAWMLEWMVLPQIVAATGAGLKGASALSGDIIRIGKERSLNT